MAKISILSGNIAVPQQALDSSDEAYFEQAWDAFSTVYDRFGTAPLTGILGPYKSIYRLGAESAKAVFKGAAFGGLTDNKGFNMQEIRAVTIRTQGLSEDVYDWEQPITSTGWAALFGSKTNLYNSGQSVLGSQNAGYTKDQVFLLLTHLYSETPPLFQEYQFGIGSVNYAVQVARFRQISGIYVTPLANPIIIPLNTNYYFMANFRRTGTEGTALLGAQFVTSQYAQLQ